jgi:hypothetical protein
VRCSSKRRGKRRVGFLPIPKRKNKIMKRYSGTVYVTLLVVIALALIATYIPDMDSLGSWATPPVVLFLGL